MNGNIIKKCDICYRNKKDIIHEGLQNKDVLYLISKSIQYFIQYKAEYQHVCMHICIYAIYYIHVYISNITSAVHLQYILATILKY